MEVIELAIRLAWGRDSFRKAIGQRFRWRLKHRSFWRADLWREWDGATDGSSLLSLLLGAVSRNAESLKAAKRGEYFVSRFSVEES